MFLIKKQTSYQFKIFISSSIIIVATMFLAYFSHMYFSQKFLIARQEKNILIAKKSLIKDYFHSPFDFDTSLKKFQTYYGIETNISKYNSNMPLDKFQTVTTHEFTFLKYIAKLDSNKVLEFSTNVTLIEKNNLEIAFFYFFITIIILIISGIINYFISLRIDKSLKILQSFVSNASHELKTPISVIYNYSEALKENLILDEDKEKHYNTLFKKSSELKDIVENLLLLSKIESSPISIKREKINLENSINTSIKKFDFLQLENNIKVINTVKNIFVESNPQLLKIVFDNLVQNTFKYATKNSEIKIYYDNKKLFFCNEFSGTLGLKEKELFKEYTRGNNCNLSTDGLGIGLSLIKTSLTYLNLKHSIKTENNIFYFIIEIEALTS